MDFNSVGAPVLYRLTEISQKGPVFGVIDLLAWTVAAIIIHHQAGLLDYISAVVPTERIIPRLRAPLVGRQLKQEIRQSTFLDSAGRRDRV
ncbi:hypothetical protein K469DRAFT_706016 [Zopfia rhizophila CBS 207.26]|uniref:Uncharacterized protein n=1 Tax=Zopfia rhizophila CBS 207.26 TaxID=1314779 RepID=A0A6A6EWR1_9PEZI|nr:hypothetical protein K469DRAFT_706016 [Zopfia rhizophila CBS 207.26]